MDTLREIQLISARRSERWHGEPVRVGAAWTGADWSNAMCGEAGEAANVVKKLRRLELSTVGAHNAQDNDWQTLVHKLADELADNVLYTVLVAEHYGIDLASAVADKFNVVSVNSGFPERLVIDIEPVQSDYVGKHRA